MKLIFFYLHTYNIIFCFLVSPQNQLNTVERKIANRVRESQRCSSNRKEGSNPSDNVRGSSRGDIYSQRSKRPFVSDMKERQRDETVDLELKRLREKIKKNR